MRKLVILVLVLYTLNLSGQICLNRDLELRGNVKSSIQTDYTVAVKNDKVEKQDLLQCSERKYEFDNQNRLLKEAECIFDIFYSFKYFYDSNGLLIKRENHGTLASKYEYDDKGNITAYLMYNDEEMFGSWHYKYDENNNRIERLGLLDGYFVERWITQYDEKGRKIREYMVDEEPDTIPSYLVITFDYNSQNRLKSKTSTDPETKIYAIDTYKYNGQGDIIEHYSKNNFQQGIEEVTKFDYLYDINGNWIKRTEIYNNQAKKITERKIEYW